MYPAIEINLHLIVFAQLSDRFRLPSGPAFGPSTFGTNLLPSTQLARIFRAFDAVTPNHDET